jgi:hypothetical protein
MFKMFRTDFYRMVTSWKFYVSIIGIAVVCLLNSLNFGSIFKQNMIEIFTAGDAPFFAIAILILETLPYGTEFCCDWENRYIRAVIMRTSSVKYAVSKAVTCFLGAILVGIIGRLLLVVCLAPFAAPITGVYIKSTIQSFPGAEWFFNNNHYFTWIIIESFERSLQGSIFAVFSLYLSTKITDIFVTLTMPIVAYYIYLNIANIFNFPNFLWLSAIFENDGVFHNNLTHSTLYAILFAVIPSIVFMYLFVKNVKRRLENG